MVDDMFSINFAVCSLVLVVTYLTSGWMVIRNRLMTTSLATIHED